MIKVIERSFLGLIPSYHFKTLFIGIALSVCYYWWIKKEPIALIITNAILYPYSRFAIDTAMSSAFRGMAIVTSIQFLILFEAVKTVLCWSLAIFTAPIGLIWIWWFNRKQS